MEISVLVDAALNAENEATREDAIRDMERMLYSFKSLCNAVEVSEYSGIKCLDIRVDGYLFNWFDFRDILNSDNWHGL